MLADGVTKAWDGYPSDAPRAREGVDDWDESVFFDAGAPPRRSTSFVRNDVDPVERNPYAPPSAIVGGIDGITSDTSETKPGVVLAALGLIGAAFIVGVARVILINLERGPIHVVIGIVFVTVVGSLWTAANDPSSAKVEARFREARNMETARPKQREFYTP